MCARLRQADLFDFAGPAATLPALGVPGSAAALTRAQKKFNTLIGKITAQRQRIQQWHDYLPRHRQRVLQEFDPLHLRLRELQIAKLALFDRAMDEKSLGKTQRAKLRDILLAQLAELMAEAPDDRLVALHDKYNQVSFADRQQAELEAAQALAKLFGVDCDPAFASMAPDQQALHIAERLQADRLAEERLASRPRKQSAKAAAREALREEAAQGATRALREVYRKLASELHPDREADPAERARKTELMQQANRAYAADDLLALLELQLSIEQIDPAALVDMAEERLAHFNRVLEEQLQRLNDELGGITAHFAACLGGRVPRVLMPALVNAALDSDLRELQLMIALHEEELLRLRDVKALKAYLRDHRVRREPDLDLDFLAALISDSTLGGGRRR